LGTAEQICTKFTNAQGRRVWSLARMRLSVKVKGQGHEGQNMKNCWVVQHQMEPISREPLNGFAPNSQGRRVWFLAQTTLNVKVKGVGHQGQKTHSAALLAMFVSW